MGQLDEEVELVLEDEELEELEELLEDEDELEDDLRDLR